MRKKNNPYWYVQVKFCNRMITFKKITVEIRKMKKSIHFSQSDLILDK